MNRHQQSDAPEAPVISRGPVLFFQLAHTRNQDRIRIHENYPDCRCVVSVVDGWHDPGYLKGNAEGANAAEFVADLFPKAFLGAEGDWRVRAEHAARQTHNALIAQYPARVSGVGTFVFCYPDKHIIVAIGTITTLTRTNTSWQKPEAIRTTWLDWRTHESGSRTFFGRGELASHSEYSQETDVVISGPDIPVLILTDGADGILPVPVINSLYNRNSSSGRAFIGALRDYIFEHKGEQSDDISVALIGTA